MSRWYGQDIVWEFWGSWESCYWQMYEVKTLGYVCKETNGGQHSYVEFPGTNLEIRMKADVCKNLNSNAEVHVTMTAPLVVSLRLLTSTFFGFLWLEIACEVWGWWLLQVQEGVNQKSLIKVLCWHLLTSVSPLLWGCVSLPAFNCKARFLWSVHFWLRTIFFFLVRLSGQLTDSHPIAFWSVSVHKTSFTVPYNTGTSGAWLLFCPSSTQCFSWGALNLSTYINQESRSGYHLLGFPKGWRDEGMASFPRALIAHTP